MQIKIEEKKIEFENLNVLHKWALSAFETNEHSTYSLINTKLLKNERNSNAIVNYLVMIETRTIRHDYMERNMRRVNFSLVVHAGSSRILSTQPESEVHAVFGRYARNGCTGGAL